MKAVIMAGGSGTRLWPLSRRSLPKQSQPVIDSQTLLQKTYQRIRRGWPIGDIFISTSQQLWSGIRPQLPQVKRQNAILEPARRDTAAAIGLVAMYLHHRHPREIMFTVNSDHYVKEVDAYIRLLKKGEQAVKRYPHQTVLIGTKPQFPDTSSGYIKTKKQIDAVGINEVFQVDRFIEKPNLATATRFMTDWQYLLNPAWFIFRVDAMLDKFKRWLNPSYKILMRIDQAIGTPREAATVKRLFPKMQKISIDYGIMEKDKNMLVVPSNVTWTDIGSWRAVYDMIAETPAANVVRGRHVTHDSAGNLLYSYSGKLIAAAGVHDMIIVETADAILVCPKNRAQDVKHIVAELEKKKLHSYL